MTVTDSTGAPSRRARSGETIHLDRVTKIFDGAVRAVDDIEMEIAAGEFFSLLGPSGCGKTTTLRMIAGFEGLTSGAIRVGGRDVSRVPAHKRDMSMVFQNYALFPHRTVFENVAFGLRMRGQDRRTIERRVAETLELVALVGYETRRPGQLSGGQQQRVALARAIVVEPKVLLCDEPLGALDKKLRQSMQFELKQLQKNLGVTLVFVTHDQEEALAMSDRIAVMNDGRVEQVGTPAEIYNRPLTRFVADFIGDTNLLSGELSRVDGRLGIGLADGEWMLVSNGATLSDGRVTAAVRPEKIRLQVSPGDVDTRMEGVVENANFHGGAILYRIVVGPGRRLLVQEPNYGERPPMEPGTPVSLGWNAADAVILQD